MDIREQRSNFVNSVLPDYGITDKKVLAAFRLIPREQFIPTRYKDFAYRDEPLPIGKGQTISQPSLVALMTQLLKLRGGEKVLEVGTGSGFQAAILSTIAGRVYSIERIGDLAKSAEKILKKLGVTNVKIVIGDGTLGLVEYSPFDAIIVTAGAKEIPQPLLNQLKVGGRMVIPTSTNGYGQTLKVVSKPKNGVKIEDIEPVAFVPLIGKFSWKN